MNINRLGRFSQFIDQLRSNDSGASFKERREQFRTEREANGSQDAGFLRGNDRARQALESARERREARRAARRAATEDTLAETDTPSTDSVTPESSQAGTAQETTPTQTPQSSPTATPSSSGEISIEELAELYVQQYEDGSGVTLSDEAFNQKKSDVAAFYSTVSNGRERLDEIVFANDGDSTTVA